ncbi:hypothetical protein WICMUC_004150 [Wickerhamomyces mucosus]|uniref:Autophagy-related protein 14 n=1 Tax=Wickerhamomyces mucosus TaxID=1378264 RepID=A0A9P8PJV8_9ASCO|nr:hypothetical protein WICMUC_004150 [Wickerhamomyces mucosus]
MNNFKCGICNRSKDSIVCSSCINFIILKPKLQYLSLLDEYHRLQTTINQILSNCIKGNNYDFINEFMQNGKVKDIDGIKSDSVLNLSSQLLNLDIMLLKKLIRGIEREINNVSKEIEVKREKLDTINDKRQSFIESFPIIDRVEDIKIIGDDDDQDHDDDNWKIKNEQISKQILISQRNLFKEYLSLKLIKRQKLNNSQIIYTISFTPIISIYNISEFNSDIINFSFQHMIKFVIKISNIWFINLPFDIDQSLPEISQLSIDNKEIKKINELNLLNLKNLINGIARLSINIFKILRFFKNDLEITNYLQLFKLDEMIYKIANPDHKIPQLGKSQDDIPILNNEKKLDVDYLSSRMFKFINTRINQKNNEWQFVKMEYFDDI